MSTGEPGLANSAEAAAGLRELRSAYADGSVTPTAVAERFLTQVASAEPAINAFATIESHDAICRSAADATSRWSEGRPLSALDGALISVKDNIAQQGLPNRQGSWAGNATPADQNAPVVDRLLEAGMIIIGRTKMPDHGCKATTDGPDGPTRNPRNLALTAGGSSGGAAASVAAGLTRLAIGSDGGGSIRIPAAFCGVVGLKPTYGQVPSTTYSPFGTLSHQGPLAANVAELAELLNLIGSPHDARSPQPNHSESLPHGANLRGTRCAVWRRPGGQPGELAPAVMDALETAVLAMKDLGCHVVPMELDVTGARTAFETIWRTGAASIVDATPASAQHFDPVLLDQAERGRSLTDQQRAAGHQAREGVRSTVHELFQNTDLILSPVTSCLPFATGHAVPPEGPFQHWHEWAPWTYPFNLTGNPALSLPVGVTKDGLPLAVQLVGRSGSDVSVIKAAHALEQHLERFSSPGTPGAR